MTVDYMSSEHSMSESDEGEANEENGYESLIWKDQTRKFLVKHTSMAQSCTHSGHA